jgi:hypothetical protein
MKGGAGGGGGGGHFSGGAGGGGAGGVSVDGCQHSAGKGGIALQEVSYCHISDYLKLWLVSDS